MYSSGSFYDDSYREPASWLVTTSQQDFSPPKSLVPTHGLELPIKVTGFGTGH